VERVNSRLDVSFGFETRRILGNAEDGSAHRLGSVVFVGCNFSVPHNEDYEPTWETYRNNSAAAVTPIPASAKGYK
jgi:hypothetical protein